MSHDKKLQKYAKIAMMTQGATRDIAYLGRKIAAVMCSKELKCSNENAAVFLGNWTKTFVPILEGAHKTIEEFTKGKWNSTKNTA